MDDGQDDPFEGPEAVGKDGDDRGRGCDGREDVEAAGQGVGDGEADNEAAGQPDGDHEGVGSRSHPVKLAARVDRVCGYRICWHVRFPGFARGYFTTRKIVHVFNFKFDHLFPLGAGLASPYVWRR